MMVRVQGLIVATMMAAISQSSVAMSLSFSDQLFDDADWAGLEVIDDTPNDSFAFVANQLLVGGVPDEYRSVVNQLNTPTASSIASGHIYQNGSFDPGQDGTFASLDSSFLGIGLSGPAGAMGYGIVLEQNNKFFTLGLGQTLNGANWAPFSASGLVADDFNAVELGANLDLSDNGDLVRFGFLVSNGTAGNSVNVGGVDDWNLTIHTVPVPLPAGIIFLASGLLLLGRKQT